MGAAHPVEMSSSQTHLLTQINLADMVRDVESSAAAWVYEIDVNTLLFVYLISIALKT